jgi:hypothetical protein
MAISRKKIDLSVERSILTGMIVSDRFLQEIIPIYKPELLEITHGTILAKWAINHFNKYEKAPKELVQDIFTVWSKTTTSSEQIKYVESFLATLSDEYEHAEKFNVDYMMDKAITYFKTRSLKVLAEDITYNLENNDLESAELNLAEYQKVEKVYAPGIDVYDDIDAWQDAFKHSETLFKLPGKLGAMMNGQFTRDSFVALMGVAKSGKSWCLTFLAQSAVKAGCNVAMFQAGDLSQGQTMLRNGIYLTQRSNKQKYCEDLLIPILDCELNQKDECSLKERKSKCGCCEDGLVLSLDDAPTDYEPCDICYAKKGFKGAVWHYRRRSVRPLTWQEAYKAAQDYKAKYKTKHYKLSTHPSRSISVSGILSQLDTWERLEGWIPDVIVVDYADILAPERKGNKEVRDDINENWIALRGLAQKRHCCVITATQANGAAINQKVLGREHYSGDRRKYDHVTAMYSLNQTGEEKRKGVMRWGCMMSRDESYDPDHLVNVLGCLQIGRPYLDSY